MTGSIDALIAEGRKLTSTYGRYSAYGELVRNLADALESTAAELATVEKFLASYKAATKRAEAELRQERERAREVIEKVRTHSQNPYEGYRGESVVRVDEISAVLATYDTKEQS